MAIVFLLAFVVSLGLFTDAFAQGGSGSDSIPSSGSAVKPEDANDVAAWDIRKKYFKRFPYAKYAGPTGKKIPDNPDGHDLVVEVGGGGAGAAEGGGGSGGGGGGSSSPKKRESVGPGKKAVLAYDICHVHCDGVGHWLPLAEWYHQPQPPCPLPACYTQPKLWTIDPLTGPDDITATKRDEELFDTALGTYKMPKNSLGVNIAPVNGLPLSDTQFQIIDREDNQRFLELLFDPEHMTWLATNTGQIQGASAANSSAGAAEASFNNALHRIRDDVLINVANEGSGSPCTPDVDPKTNSQAVWMVMQMYKEVFLPMAFLFLLPGAVLTQIQSFVYKGFFESQVSMPFEGILRATIAVFLIPATQLIVSYSIDIGNSLSESVKPWANTQTIFTWSKEQSFNPPIDNHLNVIEPGGGGSSSGSSAGGGGGGGVAGMFSDALKNAIQQSSGGEGQGKANDDLEKKTKQEKQKWLSQMMQLWFNSVEYGMAYALIALTAYQMVFMCYLFLLGPLSACFFAWPSMQGASQLFRQVFSSWTNAVINVSLWRFYWIVIMAVMTQRLLWLQDTGGINYADQWEMMVLTCFLGLMLVVPFNPFQFDPGSVAAATISKGGQMGGQATQAFQQQASAMGVPQAQIQALSQPMQQASSQMSQIGGAMGTGINIPNQALGLQQGSGVGGGLGPQGGGSGSGGAGGTQPPAFSPQASAPTATGAGTPSISQPPSASAGAPTGGQASSSQPPSAQGSSPLNNAIGQQTGLNSQSGAAGGPPVSGPPPGSASGSSASGNTASAVSHPGLGNLAGQLSGPTAAGLQQSMGSIAANQGSFPGSSAMPGSGSASAASASSGSSSSGSSASSSTSAPPSSAGSAPSGGGESSSSSSSSSPAPSPPPEPPSTPPPAAPPPPGDKGSDIARERREDRSGDKGKGKGF